MSDLFVDNIKHQSSQGSGTITIGASGETITVPDGATVSGLMSNTPMFRATMSASQSMTNETWTKIAFNTAGFNIGSAYDTSNYRFTVPSGKAGRYAFNLHVSVDIDANERVDLLFYKNGSPDNTNYTRDVVSVSTHCMPVTMAVFDLAVGDYIEPYAYHNGNGNESADSAFSKFEGYKLIG